MEGLFVAAVICGCYLFWEGFKVLSTGGAFDQKFAIKAIFVVLVGGSSASWVVNSIIAYKRDQDTKAHLAQLAANRARIAASLPPVPGVRELFSVVHTRRTTENVIETQYYNVTITHLAHGPTLKVKGGPSEDLSWQLLRYERVTTGRTGHTFHYRWRENGLEGKGHIFFPDDNPDEASGQERMKASAKYGPDSPFVKGWSEIEYTKKNP